MSSNITMICNSRELAKVGFSGFPLPGPEWIQLSLTYDTGRDHLVLNWEGPNCEAMTIMEVNKDSEGKFSIECYPPVSLRFNRGHYFFVIQGRFARSVATACNDYFQDVAQLLMDQAKG